MLITLAIIGGLFTEGIIHWQRWRVVQAKRVLFQDISRAFAFGRLEASLRGEALVLKPLAETHNWANGIGLYVSNKKATKCLRVWSWHYPKLKLTWHGFRSKNQVMMSRSPEQLAMNGYFLVEAPGFVSQRWTVNRFGTMRALRK